MKALFKRFHALTDCSDQKTIWNDKYYRKPHTMRKNIEKAVKLYSGDKPLGLFVNNLGKNLNKINELYNEVQELFDSAGVKNFEKLPELQGERAKFAQLFNSLVSYMESAIVQGFTWSKKEYYITEEDKPNYKIALSFEENAYQVLALRYKELSVVANNSSDDVPFEIEGYITEINTEAIDADYMNSRFEKYLRLVNSGASKEEIQPTLNELHKTFASLSQEEQKYASIFLRDYERGNIV